MSYRTVTMRRLPMPDSPSGRLGGNRQAATLALLAFAMLIVSLDQYIVVVALPEIGRALGYSVQTLQTVISAYAVASAGPTCWEGGASSSRAWHSTLAAHSLVDWRRRPRSCSSPAQCRDSGGRL